MKAVRFHEHGGPDVLRYEDAPDPDLPSGWRRRPRPRVRAESSRSLAAARPRARARFRCRTSPARTSPARSSRSATASSDVAAGRARDAAAGPELRPLRERASPAPTTAARSTTCSATSPTAATPSSSRCRPANLIPLPDAHRLRHGRRVSARVPDRVAHAGHARAAAETATPCSCSPPAAASGRPPIQIAQHGSARASSPRPAATRNWRPAAAARRRRRRRSLPRRRRRPR